MDKASDYRNMLRLPLSSNMICVILEEVVRYPEYFETIYQLMFEQETAVSWRATWVCEKIAEKHPEWFEGRQIQLIEKLLHCNHDGTKRLLLSTLYDLPIATPFPVDLLEFCFTNMFHPDQPIAVQSLCVKMAFKLCIEEPELMPELQMYLENADIEYYSVAVKTCVRKIKQKIITNKFSL